MVDLVALKKANAERWKVAKPTRNLTSIARALVIPSAKSRYLTVASRTGVPWYFIAVVHERESSQDWGASLAQGDPWNKVSVHVPAGRGPFASWEDAAIDALVHCPPYAANNRDWSIGGLLTMLEQYNGLGYAGHGLPSPYIWAGTDQYKSGKYIRDGVYDPNAVDSQAGCAGLLIAMMALDKTIDLGRPAALVPPIAKPPAVVPAKTVAKTGFAALLQSILSLFKRG